MKEPDLSRILQRKRNQLAAAHDWPGLTQERAALSGRRSPRGITRWFVGEEWLLISAALGVVAIFAGLMVSVHRFAGGPPWPTQPVISAQARSSTSPFDSIFLITNQSAFFDIRNLSVGCRIISARVKSSSSNDFKGSLMLPAVGLEPRVRSASANSFTCPFRDYSELAASAGLLDDPGEAQIMLMAKYDAPWWYPYSPQVSTVFTLNTRNPPPQWVPAFR